MTSTTLATLSLRVQPEKSTLDEQDTQTTSDTGYRKIDIDLIKQNGVSDPDIVGPQANEITQDKVSTSNGVSDKHQIDKTETLTQHADVLPKETNPENGLEEEKLKENPSKLANGVKDSENQFQQLPKPQQDILLLHGPGQRYQLGKAHDIPELKSEQEILVQVGKDVKFIDQSANIHRWLQLG